MDFGATVTKPEYVHALAWESAFQKDVGFSARQFGRAVETREWRDETVARKRVSHIRCARAQRRHGRNQR